LASGSLTAAPAQLGLVQSLLNTHDFESGRDELSAPDAMLAWLSARRLVSPGTQLDDADHRRLIELRAALHDLVAAGASRGLDRRAVTTLNEAARRVRLGVRLHPTDGYRVMAEGAGIDRPIGDVLMAVTAAMAAGTWSRLKVCANPECRRAFYDASRNRSARWCSMSVCGNRMKGRAYRQRARNAGATSAASAVAQRQAVAVAS
jgi:predicted RNA-binding Zn ribbon-like protein